MTAFTTRRRHERTVVFVAAALLILLSFATTEGRNDLFRHDARHDSRRQRQLETTSTTNNVNVTQSSFYGNSHSYSDYVGYHKRDIPSKHSSGNTSLTGSNVPLAGPVSYWRASRLDSNGNATLEATDLSDVFFYLALAVTWLVWLLKSFVKSDWLRYTQDSMLVRGHVLQVTRDEVETGIPTYKAVIDYFVGEHDSQIQVRKEFETQTFLEQGFGNVELLVLSDEPTASVLKEDWQSKFEEMEEERLHTHFISSNNLWKRAWVFFLAMLVLASLAGSIVAATFLPPGRVRNFGWVMVFFTIVFLFHIALWLRLALTKIERYFQVRNGIILKAGKGDWTTTSSSQELSSTAMRAIVNSPTHGTSGCDPFDVLDTNACDDTEAFSLAHDRQRRIQMSATNLDETAGCYVIEMYPMGMGRDRSAVSDVSSASAGLPNKTEGTTGVWNESPRST
mmetsp:Transcript_15540/g.20230  ORF Transcript_15540/g.20230 Transcript_15540/m.20230 type:complete len:451 (+) Transcript_15540:300-1652(+)